MLPTTEIERVFRQSYGRVFAALVRRFGDFALAGDAIQDAFLKAVATWSERGLPDSPEAWIFTVARNAAISARRHERVIEQKRTEVITSSPASSHLDDDVSDDRLRLMFCCCHPALAPEARVALTLQTLCGFDAAAIARLFLLPETTIAQRLVRAKRKIKTARIPFDVPANDRLDERTDDVLAVVYLLFTEGYRSHQGRAAIEGELCEEAIRLGRLLTLLLPGSTEARGLLALMLLHDSRRAARLDASGVPIPLEEQDRSLWDRRKIEEGTRILDDALQRSRAGPYQIEAAIAALHASALSSAATDWPQIAALYRELWARYPSPSVAISLSIAEGMAHGPERGLRSIDAFSDVLRESDRVFAARADLLRRAGRVREARAEYDRAIEIARDDFERRFLLRRRGQC